MTPIDLQRDNEKLQKINRVLMDRVERSTDAQGNAFSLFQAAITLEKMVQQRTGELQRVNAQLRREIAERAQIESALENAKSEAERAHASKTKFFAAASHDLLQPLNIARLFLDALVARERDAELLRIADRIDASLEGAESLLTTLLEISRIDAGGMTAEITDVPIDPLLRRLADDYSLGAEERNLRLRIVPCDAIVRTDLRLLDRILRNLISNALRYTSHTGVLVGCRRRGDKLRIEVWDTGIGIPERRLSEIFEEFRQLEPGGEGRGLGLGLSIVERMVRMLGTTIDVRSREGRGSVFGFDIPLGSAQHVRLPATAQAPRSNPLHGKTVLVVDDDLAALEGMTLVLGAWGCRTIEATSPHAALEGVSRVGTAPDFIVADYHLAAGRTGCEAIAGVRAAYDRSVAAVVLTADRTPEVRRRVADAGYWYLNKPVRVDRLRALMSHVLT
ncbi:MAG: hybrid sensor histidine kinase/response regulator [Vulcanimicrobiaceae bacterium]